MDAGEPPGTLTTAPLTFRGRRLFVNCNAAGGELRAEALREDGQVWRPFTAANCIPMRSDRTAEHLRWRGVDDVKELSGQPVRFRFHLTHGQLYSFWVSPETSGASHGYVGAGGPGFTGEIDAVARSRRMM